MKKVIRLTESDLVRLVKRVILEQPQNPGFYDELRKKGYVANQIWMDSEGLYSQIKAASIPLNNGNSQNIVYFEKPLSTLKSIRFITDGEKVYFLNNQYGDGRLKGFGNGPYPVEKIRKSF